MEEECRIHYHIVKGKRSVMKISENGLTKK